MFVHPYNPTNIFVLTSEYCKATTIVCALLIGSVGIINPCEENILVDVIANVCNNGISTAMQALKKVLADDNTGALKVW